MSEAVSQTLLWVNEELGNTLSEARQSLEHYIERPENTALLKACADLMHEAAGALMMVEVQGGSLLAEEVEKVARRLLEAPADQQTRAEALEALSRAMVQLPSYMERVVNGGRDIPLILLPLLNDLRAVRGRALLSENTLLLLNLPAERRVERQRPADAALSGADAQTLARQSRPRFQAALLAYTCDDFITAGRRLGSLLAPYTVIGWPLSALDAGAKATLVGLDRLGALEFTDPVEFFVHGDAALNCSAKAERRSGG